MKDKDYAKHEFLKDVEVEGHIVGFKYDWIIMGVFAIILVIAFVS